ncbi:pentatricopeptide repeat-containing protein At2g15980 [Mercurialis annua]|uniref:pentatricopeptide repeat-containing protein At2g15980 n=1 Tax=Mercurialis annua TaxID=3986 RepID=UPI00215F82BF|nr:pentatricopeptide repeat-containing protein At2g15980 [Mercurialis annua]
MSTTSISKRILPFPPKPLAPHTLSTFSTAAPPPSDHHCSPIVSDITSLLTHHRSKSRWTYLRSLILSSPTKTLTPTHFSQITLQLKSNPHLALNFFHFTLHSNPSLCSHDLHSLSTITHVLSRARMKTRAESVISYALKSNDPVKFFKILAESYRECDSAPFVFDLLVKCCLELRKIDDGLRIVRKLRTFGISPLLGTCNLLVFSVCKVKGCFVGYGVFREVFEENEEGKGFVVRPNVHSFNDLMMGFFKDCETEMVEEIWSEMERFGCVPNGFSYCVLMAGFVEDGKMDKAENLWEEMRLKGVKGDVIAYNTMIGGFCKIGEIEKAERFFREMESSGVESSCVTLEHLINGYCRVGDVDSAMFVFKDMILRDFRAEGGVIDVLVRGLCEKRRVSEALEIMMSNACVGPSCTSYELLIKGLCDDGMMNEALKLQAKMVGKGFELNSEIYDSFIDGYLKLGNEEMAAKLRKELSQIQKPPEESA